MCAVGIFRPVRSCCLCAHVLHNLCSLLQPTGCPVLLLLMMMTMMTMMMMMMMTILMPFVNLGDQTI